MQTSAASNRASMTRLCLGLEVAKGLAFRSPTIFKAADGKQHRSRATHACMHASHHLVTPAGLGMQTNGWTRIPSRSFEDMHNAPEKTTICDM